MTGPKDKDFQLEGLDWDEALAEWEEKTFLPETAKDRETQQPAALQGTPPPSPVEAPPALEPASQPGGPLSKQSTRPLYKPPAATAKPAVPRPSPPRPAPPRPPPRVLDDDLDEEEEANATVVAAIPRELLRGSGASPRTGGGLGQMFAKTETVRPEPAPTMTDLDDAPTASRRSDPSLFDPDADSSVFTSAKAMSLLRPQQGASEASPRVRTPPPEPPEVITEGAMFDPFAEPDPFSGKTPAPPVGEDETATSLELVEADAADIDALLGATDEPPAIEEADLSPGPPIHQPNKRVFDSAADTSSHVRGAIHAPSNREYDPNEETSVLSKAAFREKLAVEPAEGTDPARYRTRGELAKGTQSWRDERPAHERLSDDARATYVARAEWIEAEARANEDRTSRARGLLAASELRALVGELEQAEMLAREAAATAPTLALAPRQARALAPVPRDPATLVEALDAEARQSPTQGAMLHDALLAADLLRLAGDRDGAARRWDRAIRIAPGDPRAPLARAAERIARGDMTHPSLRLPDAPGLAPLAEAVARALKVRGVSRADLATDEPLPNDALRRAREAITEGDLARAAEAVAEIARVPELRDAASWLASSLGVATAAGRAVSLEALRGLAGTATARRALAARGVESGAAHVVEEAVRGGGFAPAEQAVLAQLLAAPAIAEGVDLDALAASPETAPLAAALAAMAPAGAEDDRAARSARVAGGARARDVVRLARLVATDAPAAAIDAALEAFAGDHDGETRAVALEMAARSGQGGEVSDAILAFTSEDEDGARDRSLAAGLVAERVGEPGRAAAAYTSAFALDPSNEGALRAAAALDAKVDLRAGLLELAAARSSGPGAAVARLESIARAGDGIDDATLGAQLAAAHAADPALPIASFLAERGARRAGDLEGVAQWIHERRTALEGTHDPVERALDDVREAMLVAASDARLAAERLLEAHQARPDDVALRELYERVAVEPLADRAAWRERRAAGAATPRGKARLLLEAVHEHERAGDAASALHDARAAYDAAGDGLARLALERAEMDTGGAARLAEDLLTLARTTQDPRERREAYERLADLDAIGRGDAASALLWHRAILEELPSFAPSLRYLEQALLDGGRIDELEPVSAGIARALGAATGGPEAAAHAQLAARLEMRGAAGEWEPTREMTQLAASFSEPSLWALRSLSAHARTNGDDASLERASLALAERATRPGEVAALVLRAGEAAMRQGELARARELLERAATEDPGDVVAWGLLAEVRQRAGDARGAAEACESLARTSVVQEHQVLAWYDAGRMWLDEARDEARGLAAFEQAAALDVAYADVFARLSALYTRRGQRHELAALLERRIAGATDAGDRARMEVERARALAEVGDTDAARRALAAALELRPDDTLALSAYAELCAQMRDWGAAEQAWVRLARLVPDAPAQRDVYARLGELYSERAVNLSRAEVALKEVLKRAPDDLATLERLGGVYRRLNDGPRALEVATQLLKLAHDPPTRRARLLDIATIHETVARDPRKAEQALESARREFPTDVGVLRSLAELYQRQRQMPAMNILLDRAAGDARRALAAGRFSPQLFEVLQTAFDLRGKREAARVVSASLAALQGQPAQVQGAGGRAGDPRLDDLLAPEALGPGLRALLARAGDALDAASALDLRALRAAPLASGPAQARVAALASSLGVPPVQVLVSKDLGRTCVPSASSPPSVVLGEPLVAVIAEPAAGFVVTRALKLVQAHASALVRTPPADLAVLVAAWLHALNPAWRPDGVPPNKLLEATRRVQAGLPRNAAPETAMLALEVAGAVGPVLPQLGATTIAWADRVALLAVGDPNAALEGIAWSLGLADGAPRDPDRRAAWVTQSAEARDLLAFSTSDAFAEARARSGAGG